MEELFHRLLTAAAPSGYEGADRVVICRLSMEKRNILELKSLLVPLEDVQSFDVARKSPNLKGFKIKK